MAKHRDERFIALLRMKHGTVPVAEAAAGAFSTRPLERKHADRKRLDRSRDTYYRRWS